MRPGSWACVSRDVPQHVCCLRVTMAAVIALGLDLGLDLALRLGLGLVSGLVLGSGVGLRQSLP